MLFIVLVALITFFASSSSFLSLFLSDFFLRICFLALFLGDFLLLLDADLLFFDEDLFFFDDDTFLSFFLEPEADLLADFLLDLLWLDLSKKPSG